MENKTTQNECKHLFENEDEWNGQMWNTKKRCLKCDKVYGTFSIETCNKSFDKQHAWVIGEYIDPKYGKMNTRTCSKCDAHVSLPEKKD